MSKGAIQGTKNIPATPTDLATLFGLTAGTMFKGYYSYPEANSGNVTEAATIDGDDTIVAPGCRSPDYNAVDLSTISISGTITDEIVVKGEGVEKHNPFG